ncbi:MAG: hypothetical protein PWP37_31 [Thermotogota bacterium]|nr:hypothetical protein [Thermotogota bacterium]MDK2863839.1 hypothetical protein [Thermotogota bacterium]HCZ05975.1 hypothetical protein [Thermotogota bacterium]
MVHRFRYRRYVRITVWALIVALIFLSEILFSYAPVRLWTVIAILVLDFLVILRLSRYLRFAVVLDLEKKILFYEGRELPLSSIKELDRTKGMIRVGDIKLSIPSSIEDREWLFDLLAEHVCASEKGSEVFR